MNRMNNRTADQILRIFYLALFLGGHALAGEDAGKTGIWRALTGDVFIAISGDAVNYYETTKGNRDVGSQATCLQVRNERGRGALEFEVPETVTDFTVKSPVELTYDSPGNLYPVSVFRVESLPASCTTPLVMRTHYQHNPALDFDIFWNQFSENYAFFAYRGITQADWNRVYRQYRAQALASINAKAFFDTLADIMQHTFAQTVVDGRALAADEHVELSAPSEEWDFAIEVAANYNQGQAVLANPLTSELQNRIDESAFAPLVIKGAIWGVYSMFAKLRNSSTGYLLLNSMVDFNTDKDAAKSIEDYEVQRVAVTNWMNRVVALANEHGLEKIIIDVRNNLGGFDKISLLFASYFADQPRLALVKQVRTGGTIDAPELSEPYQEWVYPNELHFGGEVSVLISRHTVSAGETFALAMKQFPRVRLIGEPTAGSLSDVLQRHTSNGWILSLSNEVFHDPGAETYTFDSALEGKGVQPDQLVAYDAQQHFSSGRAEDTMLDVALGIQNP